MEPFTVWLTGFGLELADGLAKKLFAELGNRFRRHFAEPEVEKAFLSALGRALGNALDSLATPANLGEGIEDRQRFEDAMTELVGHEAVIRELSQLLDPWPESKMRFAAALEVVRQDESAVDLDAFADFDALAFLERVGHEFYRSAAADAHLRERLKIRQISEWLGLSIRAAEAVEITAEHTERIAESNDAIEARLGQLDNGLREFLEGGPSHQLLSVTQIFLGEGNSPPDLAQRAYEALISALPGHGIQLDLGVDGKALTLDSSSALGGKELSPERRLALEGEITRFREALTSSSPTVRELEALERRYRQSLIRQFENLTFRGMMRTGKPIVLPLEKVYVELRSVAEVPDAADAFSVEERRLLIELKEEDERLDPEKHRELMGQLDALRRERWSQTLPDRKSIGEALHSSQHRAFVILGDPGSGKTTLLHYLALAYARGPAVAAERFELAEAEAERLPIFVPLAAYDDMRSRDPELKLRDFLPRYYDLRRGLPGLAPLFERALDSGKALLLFDGLDEVVETTTRQRVADQVAGLIGECAPRGVRFALSSRVVGYREAPVIGDVTTLTVLDFGERDIEVFVRQWSRAFETWVAGGEETPEMVRLASELERDLMRDVRSNESVRRLAANPLMLTMLSLVRRQVGRLPHRRIQLYEIYIGTLLENWIEGRAPGAREVPLATLDRHRAENLLIPLALWLQESKPSGTAGLTEMRRRLTEICLAEEGLDRDSAERPQLREAEQHANDFLKEMRETSGLLIERGHDAFGFLHLTFQEHFAGRALARMGDQERWRRVKPHLHDPRWREPLMLCAGRLGVMENRRDAVTAFVRHIFEHQDEAEPHLRRNLLLALAMAGDDVNLEPRLLDRMLEAGIAELPTKVDRYRWRVFECLVQIVVNGHGDLERCLEPISELDSWLLGEALRILGGFDNAEIVRDALFRGLRDDDYFVRQAAVHALASQTQNDTHIQDAILRALKDDNYPVRQEAVNALASQTQNDTHIQDAILRALKDPDEDVRMAAAHALASRTQYDTHIKNAILRALEDRDWTVRKAAARALASRALNDTHIKNAVLQALKDDSYAVRQEAVNALASQTQNDTHIQDAILRALKDTDEDVRMAAIKALASQAHNDTQIKSVILRALKDTDEDVRVAAIKALASQVQNDTHIKNAMLRALKDSSLSVRQAALRTLPEVLLEEKADSSLLEQVINDTAWELRTTLGEIFGEDSKDTRHLDIVHRLYRAAATREAIRAASGEARRISLSGVVDVSVSGFLTFVLESHYVDVRSVAVKALASQTQNDTHIKDTVLQTLKDRDWSVRQAAVKALASQTQNDTHIKNAILQALKDPDEDVRMAAVNALASQTHNDTHIKNAILRALEDDYNVVRRTAVGALASQTHNDTNIRNIILQVLNDSSPSVRMAAVDALANRTQNNKHIRDAILLALEDDNYAVRLAAVKALASQTQDSKHIRDAILLVLKDDNYAVRRAAVKALASQTQNSKHIRDAILQTLKDDYYGARQVAVDALASQTHNDTHIQNAILQALEGDSYAVVRMAAVNALASQAHNDIHIKNAILQALKDRDWSVRQAAVKALASQIHDDTRVKEVILRALKDENYAVRMAAVKGLSRLAHNDTQIKHAIFRALKDHDEDVRKVAVDALAIQTHNDTYIRDAILLALEDPYIEVRLAALAVFVDPEQPAGLDRDTLLAWLDLDIDSPESYLRNWSGEQIRELREQLARHLAESLPDPALEALLVEKLGEIRWNTRLGAILTLSAWPGKPPESIVHKMNEALCDMRGLESYPARLTAAKYLINRDQYSADAIELCLEALDYGAQPWEYLPDSADIREQAALVLSKLEPVRFEPAVYDKMLHVMQNDEDPDVRDAAYDALLRLARARDVAERSAALPS